MRLASFHPVAAFLSSRKATLHGFSSRGIVVRVAGGSGSSGGIVVLVARRGGSALCWWRAGAVLRCAGGIVVFSAPAPWLRLPPLLRGCVLPLLPLFAACMSHRGFLVSASGCSFAALFVVVSRCVVVLAPMRGVRGCSKVFAPRLRLGCLLPRLRLGYLRPFVNYNLQVYRAKCPKHFLT